MKKDIAKKEFNEYLKEAQSWETSRVQQLEKSRRTAWIVASVASAAALAGTIAVASLTPLKTVEAVVLRVNNATGAVDIVKSMPDGKTNYEEAINKYFVQWYVIYREAYSRELAESYYNNVGLMSASQEQQKYFQFFNPKNPMSPINVYGQFAKVKVRIKSVSFIQPNIALVRYTKEVERGSDRTEITHWASTVTFGYQKAPMKEEDRGINPLGFQVSEYRNDPDSQVREGQPVNTALPAQPAMAPAAPAVFATAEPPAPINPSSAVAPATPASAQ